jgi:hypothetical protein
MDIKTLKKIMKYTPVNQAIALEGKHGIGKSDIVKQILLEMGYTVICLFVGQMADAGDAIGLPDKIDATFLIKDKATGKIREEIGRITKFAPPAWWPRDPNAKVAIFLDEANRGKPELNQCLMDMLLNRTLNGNPLPDQTRIIGAWNPIDDGFYQVEEPDPAWLDRWNVYTLDPTPEEWADWAYRAGVSTLVIGFIMENREFLDPYNVSSKEILKKYKAGSVLPSRRSWDRVSQIMNDAVKANDQFWVESDSGAGLLKEMTAGIVGVHAASAFCNYVRTKGRGIHIGVMMTDWKSEFATQIKKLNVQEQLQMNNQLEFFIIENEKLMASQKPLLEKYSYSIEKYLNCLNEEIMAQFINKMKDAHENGKTWPGMILSANEKIVNKYISVLNGEDETQKNQKAW